MLRSRTHRFGLILTAIFQLLLPTFVSVADARAEGASARGAFAHVESHGTSNCVPVHSAECAFCRVISGGAAASRSPAVLALADRVISASLPSYHGFALAGLGRRGPSQRAPPAV